MEQLDDAALATERVELRSQRGLQSHGHGAYDVQGEAPSPRMLLLDTTHTGLRTSSSILPEQFLKLGGMGTGHVWDHLFGLLLFRGRRRGGGEVLIQAAAGGYSLSGE